MNTFQKAIRTIRKNGNGYSVWVGGQLRHLASKQDAKRRVYKHVRALRIARELRYAPTWSVISGDQN